VLSCHIVLKLNTFTLQLQEDRLRGRGTESEESLSKRLAVAKAEMQYGSMNKSFGFIVSY